MHKIHKPLSTQWLTFAWLILLCSFIGCTEDAGPTKSPMPSEKKVLMFVPKQKTYYSEYIVMRNALEASGYVVEVRSSDIGSFMAYMEPLGATIEETANTFPSSNYSEFKSQFFNMFGETWQENLNVVPASIPLDGKIQDVNDMDNYLALIIVGGTGSLDYRTDGLFSDQGDVLKANVQSASEKLNVLAIDALSKGKPVLAQCHGASLPVFWKIQGSSTSLLDGKFAAGFPQSETEAVYAANNVILRANDKVVVSSPAEALDDKGLGDFKLITTRDWYPQTVAHAAKTLLNILNTYPKAPRGELTKVLILHGGSVNEANCLAGNRENDVPCNYGGGAELPADYTHLKALLEASKPDQFNFVVTDLNLMGSLPYTSTNQTSVEAYLQDFDAVIFFKHWSTGVNAILQNALVSYAENGGGLIALHHGLYNDVDDANSALNKNIITRSLFKTESAEADWGAIRATYKILSVNYGHFVSTFNVPIASSPVIEFPGHWSLHPGDAALNKSLSVYQNIEVYDEIYTNKIFIENPVFGSETNQITPLFSNNLEGVQAHTEGFVRTFNNNNDDKIGRLAFFQAGENKQSFSTTSAYGQVIRNAVFWAGNSR